MSNYELVEKESFTVFGIGVELKSDAYDFAGINQEKTDFYNKVKQNGELEELRKIAETTSLLTVNEAVNNKMMYYVGVFSDQELSKENGRQIQFPQGMYVVVKGEGQTAEALNQTLTGAGFGQVLPALEGYAYVGGPNAIVEEEKAGSFTGELWIPVVKQ